MRLGDLQYHLPPELIAQHPIEPRDSARLLVLDRSSAQIRHRVFRDLGEYLNAGDCLVLNDTKVIPARFFCQRKSGGKIEALFLHADGAHWRLMLKPAARLKAGERLACTGSDVHLVMIERQERGQWLVRPEPSVSPLDLLGRIGQTPLPPYIRRARPQPANGDCYQTVYATRPGAVAAPTAGLHFTAGLLAELARNGVQPVHVTLHVGAGTFTPIETDDLAGHRMHAEWYEVTPAAVAQLRAARTAGGQIVAVGTTAVRVLESLPEGLLDQAEGRPEAGPIAGWTELFIYPPYRFRHVDRLVTNFHLPGSTLLALVMAFASPELIRAAYREAIAQRYRFYSYGDAMLIL